MEQEGMCTTWFTLSAVDNHWLDLNKIIYGDREMPVFANESEKLKWRRNLVRKVRMQQMRVSPIESMI